MTRRGELEANLAKVRAEIPEGVELICVTKTYPLSDVEILYQLGERNFGENRTNELAQKAAALSARWHYQGQIQSNKLKEIAAYADVVHSLDDPRHVVKLDALLDHQPTPRSIDAFIQVSLDGAEGRGGVLPAKIRSLAETITESRNLALVGLMAVAPLGEDPNDAFARLATIHRDFRKDFPLATSLSAGMSNDFRQAIAHGATHIRIGSQILGSRPPLG